MLNKYFLPAAFAVCVLAALLLGYSAAFDRNLLGKDSAYCVLLLSFLSVTGVGYWIYEKLAPAIPNKHLRQAVATVPCGYVLVCLGAIGIFLLWYLFPSLKSDIHTASAGDMQALVIKFGIFGNLIVAIAFSIIYRIMLTAKKVHYSKMSAIFMANTLMHAVLIAWSAFVYFRLDFFV
ncbi:hypothetical protein Dip510_000347 [Elusimicrobium posterum]|uniref:hypothetical protein n=1 Tax=Elusimicrobium posterum TaxID=3116653 RepID=UPI003C737E8D